MVLVEEAVRGRIAQAIWPIWRCSPTTTLECLRTTSHAIRSTLTLVGGKPVHESGTFVGVGATLDGAEDDLMSLGLLLIRLVLGLTLAAHGAQKLFGVFGGGGLRGTAEFFGTLGYRPNMFMVFGAGLCSFGGGLLMACGLLTPVGALGIALLMVNAIATVQWRHGFWARNGGYESNLLIWATAVGIAAIGPGRLSLDGAFAWASSLSGPGWGLGVAVCSIVIAALTLTVGRGQLVSDPAALLLRERQHPQRDRPTDAAAGH